MVRYMSVAAGYVLGVTLPTFPRKSEHVDCQRVNMSTAEVSSMPVWNSPRILSIHSHAPVTTLLLTDSLQAATHGPYLVAVAAC